MRLLLRFIPLALLALLAACAPSTQDLRNKADALAASAGMHGAEVSAGDFTLMVYERMAGVSDPVHIYIEGDGNAWLTGNMVSPDPTPRNPVALKLAMQDHSLNVVYMGRVCQYVMSEACSPKYWTNAQYSDAVITAYDEAMQRWQGHKLELTGYSGGAAVALLVAARRKDVVAIRTVAGNIDTDAFTALHGVSPLSNSLNPASFMALTAHIPQRHFVGAEDNVVPVSLVQGYQARLPAGNCSAYDVVHGLNHYSGWLDVWPILLSQPLPCR